MPQMATSLTESLGLLGVIAAHNINATRIHHVNSFLTLNMFAGVKLSSHDLSIKVKGSETKRSKQVTEPFI